MNPSIRLKVYTRVLVLEDTSNTVYRVYYRVENSKERELVVSASGRVLLEVTGRTIDPRDVYEKLKDVSEELATAVASVV